MLGIFFLRRKYPIVFALLQQLLEHLFLLVRFKDEWKTPVLCNSEVAISEDNDLFRINKGRLDRRYISQYSTW